MGKRLESVKRPIDADIEKDGAKEIKYKDSYDELFDEPIEPLFEEDLARRICC